MISLSWPRHSSKHIKTTFFNQAVLSRGITLSPGLDSNILILTIQTNYTPGISEILTNLCQAEWKHFNWISSQFIRSPLNIITAVLEPWLSRKFELSTGQWLGEEAMRGVRLSDRSTLFCFSNTSQTVELENNWLHTSKYLNMLNWRKSIIDSLLMGNNKSKIHDKLRLQRDHYTDRNCGRQSHRNYRKVS